MEMINSVAIDGPAGSGKGTIAKIVAKDLGMMYIDTGAMYRCVTYLAVKNGVDADNEEALGQIIEKMDFILEDSRVILNDEDVSLKIRTPKIDKSVSMFASNPFVRKKLVALQQKIASQKDVVMEGRDICSVVLKNSHNKFYLDASAETRAKRRFLQLRENGNNKISYEEVLSDIIRRDEIDSTRECDPLCVAKDAFYIDSSEMTVDEVVKTIENNIKK